MLDENEWASLVESITEGRCTPFLGAGIGYPHLPLGASLAKVLATEYKYPLADTDNLPRVAQYVSILRGGPLLKRDVMRRLNAEESAYYAAHQNQVPENYRILAGLNQKCYITTNYDGFLERALDGAGHHPVVETCRWRDQLWAKHGEYPDDIATVERPILFHLHGQLKDDLSILITEDDYIDFTVTMAVRGAQDASQSALWSQIREALSFNKILFVGYSLEDWNFRVMLKYLVKQQGIILDTTSPGISIQLSPGGAPNGEAAERFLSDYLRLSNIKVFWTDASQFLTELSARVAGQRRIAE